MAKNINTIRKIIKRYSKVIGDNNVKIDKLYLFGSYAKGGAQNDSDIDIAIISRDFKGDRFIDRRLIVPLRRGIDRRIEPIPYRPEDFKESDPLVSEIVRSGIEIT